jgi:hypothetical protein
MPIPKPNTNESKDDFIQRCMSDDVMVSEYKDEAQRYRLCLYSHANDLKAQKEISNAETYTDYPKAATENAKRALKYRDESGNPKGCGTPVGWARANQLAKREPISRETIARMASFARHLQYEDVPYEEGCGGLMVDAWGGRVGIEWAQRKLEQIDKKD